MINVALWDAIEVHLGGNPDRLSAKGKRSKTPFNVATRQRKISNIEAHLRRNPRDKQSEVHRYMMGKKLAETTGATA